MNTSQNSSIKKTDFGMVGERMAYIYTLTNASGAYVRIADYGGIVQSLAVPDRKGNLSDVVLGFDTVEGYLKYDSYFGALIGRYGNRIAGGSFLLNGKPIQLDKNDNAINHLHGGNNGFHAKFWDVTPIEGENVQTLKLSLVSPDGEENYPGTLQVTVTYTWSDKNELSIFYEAETDKTTVCNLTNHAYFNLSGDMNHNVLSQKIKIEAKRYTPVDPTMIPLGENVMVKGTAFDFLELKEIGKDKTLFSGRLYGGGYDHNFVLNEGLNMTKPAVVAIDPESGRQLEVFTTEPGVQFYTGNHINSEYTAKGFLLPKHAGFALETQHFPDSPNRSSFPSTRLDPEQRYETTTVYKFSVIK